MSNIQHRIIRVPIPVLLIRDIDSLISKGVGGFATRTEFIVDAIQERFFELTFGSPQDEFPVPSPSTSWERSPDLEFKDFTLESDEGSSVPVIVKTGEWHGYYSDTPTQMNLPEGRPLFGLHNRDFPTLWALSRLAEMAIEGPVPIESFYESVIRDAWDVGRALVLSEKATGKKSTSLFPTNLEKRKSAELGFRMYAIGDHRPNSNGGIDTSGPLFEWQVANVTGAKREPMIEVSKAGWQLLNAVRGINVDEPHAMNASASFLAHLYEYAPSDFAGFRLILEAIGVEGCNRQEILERTANNWPAWTDNEVSTNSGGYIARAREWGLVEPKQAKGRYHLTEFGEQYLSNLNGLQS